MNINGRQIGFGHPCYIVAELSANHAGALDRALKLIHAAKAAGADAVKIQTFKPEDMCLPGVKCPSGPWEGRELLDLYREAQTPWAWHPRLFQEAERVGVTLFSSPFSVEAVRFLEDLGCPAYKIASPEASDVDLARAVQHTGKPMFVSMGGIGEGPWEREAFADLWRDEGNAIPLHCVSAYPAPAENMNLLTIGCEAERGGRMGLSDHSNGFLAATTAVALGACVIEKHLMLQPNDYGDARPLDRKFSLFPDEFEDMVRSIRETEKMLGTVKYGGHSDYARSLWVTKPVKQGELFTRDNVRSLRPAGGMPLYRLTDVLGSVATRDLEPGPLTEDMVE